MAKDPISWRPHRCHDCGKRSSRSRCRTCRKALEERKVLANDSKAIARARRRAAAQRDSPKRPPALSPEERQKRADARNRGVLNDGSQVSENLTNESRTDE